MIFEFREQFFKRRNCGYNSIYQSGNKNGDQKILKLFWKYQQRKCNQNKFCNIHVYLDNRIYFEFKYNLSAPRLI